MTNHNGGDNLIEHLRQLVSEACSYPPKSLQRRQILNKIVRVVTNSGKLSRENTPYYHDALQQTWEYFYKNLEKYDPNSASLITWLNSYLKWRLHDFKVKEANWEEMTKPISKRDNQGEIRSISLEDAVTAHSDIPPLLEEIRDWVQTDENGELRKTIFRKRPEINAQVLILRRLPPDIPWEDIAKEFQLNSAEAKDLPKFYSRKCLPLLRKFGLDQGYIE